MADPPVCLPSPPPAPQQARRWLVEQQGHGKTGSKDSTATVTTPAPLCHNLRPLFC